MQAKIQLILYPKIPNKKQHTHTRQLSGKLLIKKTHIIEIIKFMITKIIAVHNRFKKDWNGKDLDIFSYHSFA